MNADANSQWVFPLTSLQIGDLQSYLSYLSLFLGPESNKFYILVDNGPWLKDLGLRSAHVWQLMVTKSRLSPFANTKARKEKHDNEEEMVELNPASTSDTHKHDRFKKWFSLIEAATISRKRVLLPVKKLRTTLLLNSELHRTLYGFIIFEVSWTNIRGINYLNELQTDTSLAVEAKSMRRWEFDSIAQAATSLSSWFSGTPYEHMLLKNYLDSTREDVFFDAENDFSRHISVDDDKGIGNINMHSVNKSLNDIVFSEYILSAKTNLELPHTPPPSMGPYKRRKVTKTMNDGIKVKPFSEESHCHFVHSQEHSEISDSNDGVEATKYRDVLILIRFDDRDLPFKLRQIIMSDLRLLRLLEYGLPSWVIFLQSYPGFCNLYRPWMCPLARALYVLISVITVLIGFYDLYKNVPVLKATAYRLCGPLLDWIETWEMVSRIKYLGTMLFLHNFKKAVEWFLAMSRTIRSFLSVVAQPITEPLLELLNYLLPLWNACVEAAESLCSVVWVVIASSLTLLGDLIEILFWPMWFILSVIWNAATSIIFPIIWILGEILWAPFRVILVLFTLIASAFNFVFELMRDACLWMSSIFQFASSSEAAAIRYETSLWRSLWNDLFSQVFRAVGSILNGFVAFFTACNRHRLSIYNYLVELHQRLGGGRNPRCVEVKDSRERCRSESKACVRYGYT